MTLMIDIWTGLTEGQALLISSLATLLSAFIVAVLGPWILQRRLQNMDASAREVHERIQQFNDLFASLEAGLSHAQNAMSDYNDRLTQQQSPEGDPTTESEADQWRREVMEAWADVRDRIETLASQPSLHSKRRAKYARIDRRNYGNLLSALSKDGVINSPHWDDAYKIWSRYRTNRSEVSQQDVEMMRSLRRLLPQPISEDEEAPAGSGASQRRG